MPLDDDALVIPATGHYLTGATSATQPTYTQIGTFVSTVLAGGTVTYPTGFTNLGHTDLDDILAFGQDDGDTEVKGSWQNKSLRELITSEAIDYFVAKAFQFDNETLTLYYGGGTISTAHEFALPDSPGTQERAVCIVLIDGTDWVAFYAQRSSVRREDAPEFATDDFGKFPLRFTILKKSGSPKAKWIGENLGTNP